MNQREFWEFIESSRKSGTDNDELRDHMKSLLESVSDSDLVDYTNIYHTRIDRL